MSGNGKGCFTEVIRNGNVMTIRTGHGTRVFELGGTYKCRGSLNGREVKVLSIEARGGEWWVEYQRANSEGASPSMKKAADFAGSYVPLVRHEPEEEEEEEEEEGDREHRSIQLIANLSCEVRRRFDNQSKWCEELAESMNPNLKLFESMLERISGNTSVIHTLLTSIANRITALEEAATKPAVRPAETNGFHPAPSLAR